MKIILTSVGTRGDMEPFLAIGEILKEKGHHIIYLFPEQFRHLAEDSGFEFVSLGTKFMELLDTPEAKIAVGGGKFGFKKLKAYIKLISMQPAANEEMIKNQEKCIEAQKPDRIVHHPKAIYPILWSIQNSGKTTFISPVPYMHYVEDHPHIIFSKNYGKYINKLTYKLVSFGSVKSVTYSQKWLKDKSRKLTSKKVREVLSKNNVIYTISPSLFQRPKYWNDNLQVLGFHERNKTRNWNPSLELDKFLKQHPKFVFITFGSMVNNEPEKNTKTILQILERHKIPSIINTCAGGIIQPKNYNSQLIHFVESIPYDWIFPKTYSVIHHGGSGTTHMALKYGCATMIIPHIIDQFVWNKIVHKKGVGPLGLDIGKITINNLEPKVIDLMENDCYKQKAQELSKEIKNENFRNEICNFIMN